MKEMKRSKVIRYRWWRNDKSEIKPEHIKPLEDAANDIILKMMSEGYISGVLNDNIHMTDDDPQDGVEYRGWWEVSTST